mmetsp:Transcript_37989/g.53539  ORF Transcript_37989/g.53539 Transcript_37989/m.53539 type:complete len:137 (-) Transcript_37989:94-504(-)
MLSRFFKISVIALFLVVAVLSKDCKTPGECANPDAEDPKCPSRRHIIKCSAEYLDLNKNDKLERAELETAISNLPWLARGVLKIIGSTDMIMKKCDVDGDDAIGMTTDMEQNAETCLATCFKRRAFKGAFFSDCTL